MKSLPVAVLVVAALLVAVSVVAAVHGASDGTTLFLAVGSVALRLVANVALPTYTHQHYELALAVAVLLNLVLFLIPAVSIFLVLHKRKPFASACTTAIWCTFYIACVLVLFPVTDGR